MTMKTIVMAEIGENHYGRWDVCRGMVEEAAANGATMAKFQTYTANQFGKDHEWYEWFQGVEMPEKVHFEMQELCREKGIEFLSSTFTIRSTDFLLDKMGLTSLKLASSRIVDHELLDYVNSRADQVKTVYLSTGGATLAEIHDAVDRLARIDSLSLLHCVSQYPTDDHNVNLRAIPTIKAEFPHLPIGYSDHSRGIEACLAAVALGAEVLEKHFTYHTCMPGDDHEGALTPETLRQLVEQVSRLEVMLGSDEKGPVTDETKALSQLRGKLLEVDFD
jgi:N,N'-diacetyllegionaminate synthase